MDHLLPQLSYENDYVYTTLKTVSPPCVYQCTPDDLDDRVIQQLRNLAPADAADAVEKLIRSAKAGTVRNISAYLAGVIRRVAQTPAGMGGSVDDLHPKAASILEYLYSVGAVKRGELDSRPLRNLSMKQPELQVLILETFRDRNLNGIRNMAGKSLNYS